MATLHHCAFLACRKRSDEPRFQQQRPLDAAVAERFPRYFKPHHSGILCNQHALLIKRQLTASPSGGHSAARALLAAAEQPGSSSFSAPLDAASRTVSYGAATAVWVDVVPDSPRPLDDCSLDDFHCRPSSPIPGVATTRASVDQSHSVVTASCGGNKKRRTAGSSKASAAMAVTGYRPDSVTVSALRRVQQLHRQLTAATWNGSSDHLVAHARDADVGVTNGEMQQQPFCELLQTMMTHPNVPAHARLRGARETQRDRDAHFWLDIGSGYGLAVLRARVISGARVCAGIEIAQDRVFISHQLAELAGMQDQAQFVAANVEDEDVLPILLAATHLFSYNAVFSDATCEYIARVLRREDSNWLVYVTFDKLHVFTQAGITIHTEPHAPGCCLGGVHLLGRTKPLAMSVSNQSLTASILLRCIPPSPRQREKTWKRGTAVLTQLSSVAAQQARQDRVASMASSKRSTRSATRSAQAMN